MLDSLEVFGDAGEAETPLAAADVFAIEYGYAWVDERSYGGQHIRERHRSRVKHL